MLHFAEYQQLDHEGRLYLPFHVRAALGYGKGREVYLVLPNSPDVAPKSRSHEILVSAIPPTQWRSLWHIGMVCRNRGGLLAELNAFLDDHALPQLSSKVAVTDQGDLARFEFLIESANYEANPIAPLSPTGQSGATVVADASELFERRRIFDLQSRLMGRFADDLALTGEGLAVSVRLNLPFWRAARKFNEPTQATVVMPTKNAKQGTQGTPDTHENAYLKIPRPWIERFAGAQTPGVLQDTTRPYAYLTAETDFYALRITLTFPNKGIINVKVDVGDEDQGRKTKIFRTLTNGGFDILQTYARSDTHTRMRVDLLIEAQQKTADNQQGMTDSELQSRVVETLVQAKIGVSKEDIEFYTPKTFPSMRPGFDSWGEEAAGGVAR